jgi:uncharacterized membrane protein YdjX (TVP38/TMEM64 family)
MAPQIFGMNEDTQSQAPVMTRLLHLLGDPRVRIAIALCTLATLALVVVGIQLGITPADLRAWLNAVLLRVREHPFLLYVLLCTLPALPLPASPLLILAGVVYIPLFGAPVACLLAISAMMINMSAMYWVGAYPARSLVKTIIEKYDFRVPKLTGGGALQFVIVLRVTPGFPFFLQNLLLGFLHVPFRSYIIVSAIINAIFVTGFVISGGAIFEGKGLLALVGIFVIALAVAGTTLLRKKFAKKKLDATA